MDMQRRHYELIAFVVRTLDLTNEQDREHLANKFAEVLGLKNTNFNTNKFVDACDPRTHYKEKSGALA